MVMMEKASSDQKGFFALYFFLCQTQAAALPVSLSRKLTKMGGKDGRNELITWSSKHFLNSSAIKLYWLTFFVAGMLKILVCVRCFTPYFFKKYVALTISHQQAATQFPFFYFPVQDTRLRESKFCLVSTYEKPLQYDVVVRDLLVTFKIHFSRYVL